MKTQKYILLIILLVILSENNSEAQGTEPNGYQKAKWGMSIEKVKSLFDKEWTQPTDIDENGEQSFNFYDIIAGYQASVNFYLFENKLYEVIIGIRPPYVDADQIRLAFHKMKELVKAKYGKPNKSDIYFIPSETGKDTWSFKSTRIDVDYDFSSGPGSPVQIRYNSKVLEKACKDRRIERDKNKF